MGSSPLVRLVLRMDRRTWATTMGIAVAILLPVGSQLLVDGLASGVEAASSKFPTPPTLFLAAETLSASSIDVAVAMSTPGRHIDLTILHVMLTFAATNLDGYAAAAIITNESDSRPWIPTAPGDVLLGERILAALPQPPNPGDNLSLRSLGAGINATYRGLYRAADGIPDLWALVPNDTIVTLDPTLAGRVTAILVSPDNTAGIAHLLAAGLRESTTVGGSEFVVLGTMQAGSALQGVSIVSAVVVGLIVGYGMAVEVLQREPEIRILRQIGATPRRVAALYAGQAIILSALGGAIGTALGIVTAHAVVSFAPLAGLPNLVVFRAPPGVIGSGILFAIVPGAIASLEPARIAGRIYRSPRGVIRSS